MGFDQVMHAFQSVATPAPSVDWADGEGDSKEHFKRMKDVEKEVTGMITINAIFNCLHILPLVYLAWTVTERQWLLEESIGALDMETEAYVKVWKILPTTLAILIIGPIISSYLFKKINSSYHQSAKIISEEIEKDKAEKQCC